MLFIYFPPNFAVIRYIFPSQVNTLFQYSNGNDVNQWTIELILVSYIDCSSEETNLMQSFINYISISVSLY